MMKAYSGYFVNDSKLLASASGGAATALSEKIIENGGVVIGVRYSEDYYGAEYCCVEDIASLDLLKGSKYTESSKKDIYIQLKEHLNSGRTVLFFGLGCDVAAARVYCEKQNVDTSKFFTVDILCHGPAIKGVHESYVKELEQKFQSKVIYFTIRYKKNGWTPFYVLAKFKNGQEYITSFDESSYGRAFYHLARPSCTCCKYKGENHKGDLCIGDFWGMKRESLGWNNNGVSIMIVQTDKGDDLINMFDDSFHLQEENIENVLAGNPMYSKSRHQKADYDRFNKDLKEHGLEYAVAQFPLKKIPLTNKVRNKLSELKSLIIH